MTNRKSKKIDRILKDLQGHYPDNVYKINEKYQIIRISGSKPHKIKKENKI